MACNMAVRDGNEARFLYLSLFLSPRIHVGESHRFFRQVSKLASRMRCLEKLLYFLFYVNFNESSIQRISVFVLIVTYYLYSSASGPR